MQTCTTRWTVKHSDKDWGILDGNMNIECVTKIEIISIVQSEFSFFVPKKSTSVLCCVQKVKTHQPSRSSEGCREFDAEQNEKKRTGEKQGKHRE